MRAARGCEAIAQALPRGSLAGRVAVTKWSGHGRRDPAKHRGLIDTRLRLIFLAMQRPIEGAVKPFQLLGPELRTEIAVGCG